MATIEVEIRSHGIEQQDVTVAQLAPVDNYHWLRLAGALALAALETLDPPSACHLDGVSVRLWLTG